MAPALDTAWNREFGGASKPLMRVVTLLAIADMGCACVKSTEAGSESSSTGETLPAGAEVVALARVEVLFLPKLSFHFDGFLVTGAGKGVEGDTAAEETSGRVFLRSAVGTAYIVTGSKGFLLVVEDEVLVEADLRDEALEALLISLARDSDAIARVTKV